MIKNIIFDIGNVLLDFKPAVHFKDIECGDEVCYHIFHSPYWKEYDLGTKSLSEVKDILIREKPEYQPQIEEILSRWTEVLTQRKTVKHIKSLSEKGYHIYLLSNLSCDAADYIKKRYDLFDQVDGYVLSCDVNYIKPDKKIYQILLDNYHLKPHESVFLDDLKDNVESAKALGMYGIQVVDEDKALKELYEVIEEDQNVEEKTKD